MMHLRRIRWPLLLAIFPAGALLSISSTSAEQLPVLSTVREVRQLSLLEAGRTYPVRLEGLLTYYEPHASLAFVHDGTGCIYFGQRSNGKWLQGMFSPAAHLRVGRKLVVEGFTDAGTFSPRIMRPPTAGPSMHVLGDISLPEASRIGQGSIVNPRFHNEWVEVQGIVRGISQGIAYQPKPQHLADHTLPVRWVLDVYRGQEHFEAIIPNQPKDVPLPTAWRDAEVRLRGVYAARYDPDGQQTGMVLYVPSPDEVRILDGGHEQLFSMPVRSFDEVLRFRTEDRRRMRVRGIVTLHQPKRGLYLTESDRGLWVETSQDLRLSPGQPADVVGFPGMIAGQPCLRDGVVQAGEPGHFPPPKPIGVAQLLSGTEHAGWVQMEGILAGELNTTQQRVLLMRSGSSIFEARIPHQDPQNPALILQRDSVLQLRGVALAGIDGENAPHLLLPSTNAVAVLSAPPWWNTTRLAFAGGTAILLAFAAFAWVATLRRKVHTQTEMIKRQVRNEELAAERSRIARDLHDTMEQHLTGIATQLDLLAARLPQTAPTLHSALQCARAMLRHARAEARHSVWDLRMLAHSRESHTDLIKALQQLKSTLAVEGVPQIELSVRGQLRPFPDLRTTQLLRIAQEAVTNAVKHAQASTITVDLESGSDGVRLRIADDGRGFQHDENAAFQAGHFGLLGMRERAAKIGAHFQVESNLGIGTAIIVTVSQTDPDRERQPFMEHGCAQPTKSG